MLGLYLIRGRGAHEPSNSYFEYRRSLGLRSKPGPYAHCPEILSRFAAELALFAGVGFLLFAINDLVVDLIYFARRPWRSLTVYTRFPRAFASYWVFNRDPGFIAMLVPAWDEASVIASMLQDDPEAAGS